jgi:uncharacterized protein (TIGR03118 family)
LYYVDRWLLYAVVAMKKVAICLFLTISPRLLPAATGYLVHNLVADVAATAKADFYDPRLVNPWGVAYGGPFWFCDAGISTLYSVAPLVPTPALGTPNATTQPTVPGVSGGKGSCTGIAQNTSPAATPPRFPVTAPGKPPVAASFIFATEEGVISAWANGADPTQAIVEVDNSKTASYKGLALLTTPAVQLYAANFKAATIDVFDDQFKPVTLATGAFTDPQVPAGFAPFNIVPIGGKLYVTYAKQNASKEDDVAGVGNGYVAVFDASGKLLQHLISGGTGFFGAPGPPVNSPWGVALAPATFGAFAGDLLVGNFGDGLINAFNPTTGEFVGSLQDQSGATIKIPGLWTLVFGNGATSGDKDTLYFTAGPGGEKHGIFGSISANPAISSSTVTSAGQAGAGIAPNTYVTIKGTNLAATKRVWTTTDFGTSGTALPTSLDGVTVTVNGKPAFVEYISPVQINILTPPDLATSGQLTVVVNDNGLTSSTVSVPGGVVAPSFFLLDATHIAAEHGNFSLVGTTGTATPAKPGETIALYGTGFGVTSPAAPNGQVLTGVSPLTVPPTVTIGGQPATVVFSGLTGTGLYQINVTVPNNLPDGDAQVVATVGGVNSPAGALISIKN